MEQKKYFKLVDGAAGARSEGGEGSLELRAGADVGEFLVRLLTSNMKVFPSMEAQEALTATSDLDNYGLDEENPIVVEMPRVWFRLVGGTTRAVHSLPLTGDNTVEELQRAVFERTQAILPPGVTAQNLRVFASSEEQEALNIDTELGGHGMNRSDPLVVEVPRVWFRLVDEGTRGAFAGTSPTSVPLTKEDTIEALLKAVKRKCRYYLDGIDASDLTIRDHNYRGPLDNESLIGERGKIEKTAFVVKVPAREVEIKETKDESVMEELQLYQKRGRMIRENCQEYCNSILDKVDEYYVRPSSPIQFMCVQGSSGMGKSQLAFALDGRRPYFYWISRYVDGYSQSIYRTVASLSNEFLYYMKKDKPQLEEECNLLYTRSEFYAGSCFEKRKLWTFGFIRALLEQSRLEKYQHAKRMIRFEERITLHVDKCDLGSVRAVVKEMRGEEKERPSCPSSFWTKWRSTRARSGTWQLSSRTCSGLATWW